MPIQEVKPDSGSARSEWLKDLSPGKRELLFRLLQDGFPERKKYVINRTERKAKVPLSFPQEQLWFIDQMEPGKPLYNVSEAV